MINNCPDKRKERFPAVQHTKDIIHIISSDCTKMLAQGFSVDFLYFVKQQEVRYLDDFLCYVQSNSFLLLKLKSGKKDLPLQKVPLATARVNVLFCPGNDTYLIPHSSRLLPLCATGLHALAATALWHSFHTMQNQQFCILQEIANGHTQRVGQ